MTDEPSVQHKRLMHVSLFIDVDLILSFLKEYYEFIILWKCIFIINTSYINYGNVFSLLIPLILMSYCYYKSIHLYRQGKDFKIIFTKAIVPNLIIAFCLWSGISHICMGGLVSKSIGWENTNSNGFQKEVGMFQLAIGGLSWYYLNTNNINSLTAVSLVWVYFILQATLLHIKEIIFDKNYNFNTIRPVITGTINSIAIFYVINKINIGKNIKP